VAQERLDLHFRPDCTRPMQRHTEGRASGPDAMKLDFRFELLDKIGSACGTDAGTSIWAALRGLVQTGRLAMRL
jgi:hypothetical protein